jgi:hypothetical protein
VAIWPTYPIGKPTSIIIVIVLATSIIIVLATTDIIVTAGNHCRRGNRRAIAENRLQIKHLLPAFPLDTWTQKLNPYVP